MKKLAKHSFVFLLVLTMLVAAPKIYAEMGVPAWVRAHVFHREEAADPSLSDQTETLTPPATPEQPTKPAPPNTPDAPVSPSSPDDASGKTDPPSDPAASGTQTQEPANPPSASEQDPFDTADKRDPGAEDPDEPFTFPDEPVKPEDPFQNALFIGDSRTVGIAKFAGIEGADFYACTGMSVYTVWKETSSVGNWGKMLLEEVLQQKDYDRIYLMLGINELGYNMDKTIATHAALVARIRELQPRAYLMICANMHVTQKRSSSDKIINNARIDQLDAAFSQQADGKSIFYLDVNPVFDDENGALGAQYTQDNTHILGKYYALWKDFLLENTPA